MTLERGQLPRGLTPPLIVADTSSKNREGSLEAPTRHPLDWRSDSFYDDALLDGELERVFDVCHGCRRCFNLCNAFPTLFDAIDESAEGEVSGLEPRDFREVVDHCYLCDMCYMSKCPYVPPHPWNIDFPKLMLRAKAKRFRDEGASLRDRTLSATDRVGTLAGIPVVARTVNAVNRNAACRGLLEKLAGVHRSARLPEFAKRTLARTLGDRLLDEPPAEAPAAREAETTHGRVLVFATCYGRHHEPAIVEDLVAVLEHNDVPVRLMRNERCCGMPKLENGDLEQVEQLAQSNIPRLARWARAGWDIVAPVPSCVLMFKQELPLMLAGNDDVIAVRDAIRDPSEFLMLRHKAGLLNTQFREPLGKIAYHVPCHLRVQNLGLKTRDLLELVPETSVEPIERCSGHDGTYAVKREFHETAMKIGRPVFRRVRDAAAARFTSDCPMAAYQIEEGSGGAVEPIHPLGLLRRAYGI
ncbi:ferredoxin [soil metagenome]